MSMGMEMAPVVERPPVANGQSSPPPCGEGKGRSSWVGVGRRGTSRPPSRAPPPRPSLTRGEGEEGARPAFDLGPADSGAALYRLMTFMSPAYPVGAFSYSGGIEWAVAAGDIGDAGSLRGWLESMIRHGSVFCDSVIFAHAHRAAWCADDKELAAPAELAAAIIGSKERFLETTSQGQAFLQITRSAWPSPALDRLVAAWDGPLAYPVVVAAACAGHGIEVAPALHALLHGMASNLISAGMRLIPLGQTDGQRVLAALEASITQTAERALATGMDDIATATVRADIAGMRHETQYTRLFRS
jgi:urease accessory protein